MEKYFTGNSHWKCNEFVTDVHREGDPCGGGFATAHHGYLVGPMLDLLTYFGVDDATSFPNKTKPTVADLANPEFAKDKMDYLDIKDVQPGDIIAWYDPSRRVHHTGIYSGDGNYISAYGKMIIGKQYAGEFEGTTPIVRRYR